MIQQFSKKNGEFKIETPCEFLTNVVTATMWLNKRSLILRAYATELTHLSFVVAISVCVRRRTLPHMIQTTRYVIKITRTNMLYVRSLSVFSENVRCNGTAFNVIHANGKAPQVRTFLIVRINSKRIFNQLKLSKEIVRTIDVNDGATIDDGATVAGAAA